MPDGRTRTMERGSVRLAWAAGSHVGHVRQLNEDSFVAEPGVFAIADGMGGHAAGEVASRLAVEEWASMSHRDPVTASDVADVVNQANHRVWGHANANGTLGMGTTLVGLALIDNAGDDALLVANVGDSRCYVMEDEELRRVTHDHSVVQELVDCGLIAPDAADSHPERNVVTRAIGIEPSVAADFVVLDCATQQRILLCSDGVSGQISDQDLATLLTAAPDAATAVDSLFQRVLSGPAPDNVTVIVVDVQWLPADRAAQAADITGPRAQPTQDSSDIDDTNPRGIPLIVALPRSHPLPGAAADAPANDEEPE